MKTKPFFTKISPECRHTQGPLLTKNQTISQAPPAHAAT